MHGSRGKIPSKKSRPYIYDVTFLALLGAPYIYTTLVGLGLNISLIKSALQYVLTCYNGNFGALIQSGADTLPTAYSPAVLATLLYCYG
jgi:hypothetical protein